VSEPAVTSAETAETDGRVVGLQCSAGGVPKLPVQSARVRVDGMEGDRQRKPFIHGGPQRALCIYSQERIDALAAEGHPIVRGSVGENVTLVGLPWELVQPGAHLTLGEVDVVITSYTSPCRTIRGAFVGGRYARISQDKHPGWSRVYARVLREGVVSLGDAAHLTLSVAP
jgi:MOSC domain-containing protein YiiM